MSILKKNILANYGGAVWTALMSLVFVPCYIHMLGIAAYGLIGVFATILAVFGLLDMGLSGTLNREMARLAAQETHSQQMRDLVRTLEIPYWLVGLLISLIVMALAPIIAQRWVHTDSLTPRTVRTAIVIMGLALACQWPIGLYSGGLMGLQRQVLLSGINIVMATFRGLGAVCILSMVSATIEAFFWWQMAVSILHVGLICVNFRRCLPPAAEPARFRLTMLLHIWRFAAGMTGITILVTILMQLDKIILIRMLSLDVYGYYTLASVVAMNLGRFVSPVFSATYPRMTNLVALGSTMEIIRLYHKSAQLVSVLVLPAALMIALFSKEIIFLWTQSTETAENTHTLVSILVIGTAVNGLMSIPYALQLANGWTRLAIIGNGVSVLLLVPLMVVLTKWYGAVGAASVWVVLNVGYMFIIVPIMHRRLLCAEKWRWYFVDVGLPLSVAVVISIIGRCIIRPGWPPWFLAASIGVFALLSFLASASVANQLEAAARMRSLLNVLRPRLS